MHPLGSMETLWRLSRRVAPVPALAIVLGGTLGGTLCGTRCGTLFGALCGRPAASPAGEPGPPADKPGTEAAPPRPDRVHLKGGKVVEGTLLDVTDAKVVIRVGTETRKLAPTDVREIERGAPKKSLDLVEKKFKEYEAKPSVKSWRALADVCGKRGMVVECRRALRKLIELEPSNAKAREELGHARLDGKWLDEDAVEAKCREGYEVVDGNLARASTVTGVKVEGPAPSGYRVLARQKLSPAERKTMEAERQKRLRLAETYIRQKLKEYEGVPWLERFKVKTPNFEVQCNATLELTRQYGALMEMIRDKLQKMFPSRNVRGELRAPVFIYSSQDEFISQDDFGQWAGRGLGGYYNPISQAITTFHGTFGFTGTTFGVLCHEGTHYYQGLVLKKFDNVPIWLIEGLAVYIGDGSILDPGEPNRKPRISVGNIPRDRLAHIQDKMALGRHTHLDELVVMDRRSGKFTGSTYADAWALIYFLVNSGEKGKALLLAYWAIGLERQITKDDFRALAEKHFEGMDALEKEYVAYISSLAMPSAGKVVGDYFTSDTFQFDYKAPSEDWEFFEDRDDRKLLVGLRLPGSSAEIRIYYENNLENAKAERFFDGYQKYAERRFKELKWEKVKVSNLDGYKVTYMDDGKGGSDLIDLSELIRGGDGGLVVPVEKKEKKEKGPRQVVKFLLIQTDGVVSIECSAKPGEAGRFLDVFEKANEAFTLTLTRRW